MDESKLKLSDILQKQIICVKLTYAESEALCRLLDPYTGAPFVGRELKYLCSKFCLMLDTQMHAMQKCHAEKENGICGLDENLKRFHNEFSDLEKADINPLQ